LKYQAILKMNDSVLKTFDKYFVQISSLLLTIIAIIGNSLVFYILTRPKFIKESVFRYFIASEIVASVKVIVLWIYSIPNFINWKVTDMYCKLFMWIVFVSYDLYPWVSVINSIDRFVSLKYPSRFVWRKQIKFQSLTIISIIIFLVLINSIRFFFSIPSPISVCQLATAEIGFYVNLANMLISSVVPFLIMLISAFLIVYHLISQKLKLQQNAQNYSREKIFIRSTLVMNFWFLICYSPFCITLFLQYVLDFNNIDPNVWKLILDSTIILSFCETSCNFFIHFSCNKLFRNYFLSMFRCCRRRNSNSENS
jgi:hypothetical protein